MSTTHYYLQDSRDYVGNDVLWWAKDGKGYTTDLSKAHVYTKDEAVAQNKCRPSDIPWPCEYIDARTRPAVDMQYIKRDEALASTDIELAKPDKPAKPERYKCVGCGVFMSDAKRFSSNGCDKCGEDNRP